MCSVLLIFSDSASGRVRAFPLLSHTNVRPYMRPGHRKRNSACPLGVAILRPTLGSRGGGVTIRDPHPSPGAPTLGHRNGISMLCGGEGKVNQCRHSHMRPVCSVLQS